MMTGSRKALSLLLAAVMTAGILISQVVTGIFAAYGFSKGKFKGQNVCFIIVLGALMIPLARFAVLDSAVFQVIL